MWMRGDLITLEDVKRVKVIMFFLIVFAASGIAWPLKRKFYPEYTLSQITRCASLPQWCAEEMPDLHEVVEAIREGK